MQKIELHSSDIQERFTKTEHFMTTGAGVLVLGRDPISNLFL